MLIHWPVSEREHPQKCHFLYLLERPLQPFCTTVRTVMNATAHCYCWLQPAATRRVAKLLWADLLYVDDRDGGSVINLATTYRASVWLKRYQVKQCWSSLNRHQSRHWSIRKATPFLSPVLFIPSLYCAFLIRRIFITRRWLRYVRIFAVVIPSVCLTSVVCRL